jgi:hypothetical protein
MEGFEFGMGKRFLLSVEMTKLSFRTNVRNPGAAKFLLKPVQSGVQGVGMTDGEALKF